MANYFALRALSKRRCGRGHVCPSVFLPVLVEQLDRPRERFGATSCLEILLNLSMHCDVLMPDKLTDASLED